MNPLSIVSNYPQPLKTIKHGLRFLKRTLICVIVGNVLMCFQCCVPVCVCVCTFVCMRVCVFHLRDCVCVCVCVCDPGEGDPRQGAGSHDEPVCRETHGGLQGGHLQGRGSECTCRDTPLPSAVQRGRPHAGHGGTVPLIHLETLTVLHLMYTKYKLYKVQI